MRLAVPCAIIAFTLAGCSGSPKVTLSDAQVTFPNAESFKASVHYKLTQGKPKSGLPCKVNVTFYQGSKPLHMYTLLEVDGGDFPREGTAVKEFPLRDRYRSLPAGATLRYQFAVVETTEDWNKLQMPQTIPTPFEGTVHVPK